MKALCFIPARGGSKRVHQKNLRTVGGVSLVARAVIAAHHADCIAWVSTDDAAIAAEARSLGAEVHERKPEHATDTAQIEPAISDWLDGLTDKPDAIVMLQAAAPFRTATNIRDAVAMLDAGADCVVGLKDVSMDLTFSGRIVDGLFVPNRERLSRPRSQTVKGTVWRETGSLYAFTYAHWMRVGDRMWGEHMAPLVLNDIESMDIDTPEDLAICQAIAVAEGL